MQGLNELLAAIRADYRRPPQRWPQHMLDEFDAGLRVEEGKKYLKIIQRNSVWGFVVNVHDDAKFAYGDILKAAGWATPARNKPRGNVVTGDLSWVRWTGPEYL